MRLASMFPADAMTAGILLLMDLRQSGFSPDLFHLLLVLATRQIRGDNCFSK
jgi:hypothetical protein